MTPEEHDQRKYLREAITDAEKRLSNATEMTFTGTTAISEESARAIHYELCQARDEVERAMAQVGLTIR